MHLAVGDGLERCIESAPIRPVPTLIAADQHDDPPMSVVIDAALWHLLEYYRSSEDVACTPVSVDGEMAVRKSD